MIGLLDYFVGVLAVMSSYAHEEINHKAISLIVFRRSKGCIQGGCRALPCII